MRKDEAKAYKHRILKTIMNFCLWRSIRLMSLRIRSSLKLKKKKKKGNVRRWKTNYIRTNREETLKDNGMEMPSLSGLSEDNL